MNMDCFLPMGPVWQNATHKVSIVEVAYIVNFFDKILFLFFMLGSQLILLSRMLYLKANKKNIRQL